MRQIGTHSKSGPSSRDGGERSAWGVVTFGGVFEGQQRSSVLEALLGTLRVVGICASMLGSMACAGDATCDPGYEMDVSACLPVSQEGADGGGGGPQFPFGEPCEDEELHSDCMAPAPYCAIKPGDAAGYCSAIGCAVDSTVCPTGWTCFEIPNSDPPSVCLQPS